MLINLSEVFTLEGKERTWTVPLEMRSCDRYGKESWKQEAGFNGRDEGHADDSLRQMSGAGGIHLRNRL